MRGGGGRASTCTDTGLTSTLGSDRGGGEGGQGLGRCWGEPSIETSLGSLLGGGRIGNGRRWGGGVVLDYTSPTSLTSLTSLMSGLLARRRAQARPKLALGWLSATLVLAMGPLYLGVGVDRNGHERRRAGVIESGSLAP